MFFSLGLVFAGSTLAQTESTQEETTAEKTQEKLTKILPFTASVRNPVDVAGGTDSDPSLFAECVRILLKDSHVGGLLMVGLFGGYGVRFAESLTLKEEDAADKERGQGHGAPLRRGADDLLYRQADQGQLCGV